MPFYEQLIDATGDGQRYLLCAPLIQDVYQGNFDRNTYLAFLHQAYHHVRHTVPLLSAARENLAGNQRWVANALSEYIAEESGHEQWILDDIEACGASRAAYAGSRPTHESEVMVAFLYDFVNRVNPMGIFGMVLVLEGTSASLAPEVARIVQGKLGLSDNAMSYLTSHGTLDQEHIRHFQRTMDRVEDPRDRADIIHVAQRMYRLYGDVYRVIPATASQLAEAA